MIAEKERIFLLRYVHEVELAEGLEEGSAVTIYREVFAEELEEEDRKFTHTEIKRKVDKLLKNAEFKVELNKELESAKLNLASSEDVRTYIIKRLLEEYKKLSMPIYKTDRNGRQTNEITTVSPSASIKALELLAKLTVEKTSTNEVGYNIKIETKEVHE